MNIHTPPLIPNQSPFPSSITNDPALGPLAIGGMLDYSEVPGETTIGPEDGSGVLYTPQGPTNDLMSLRAKFPFLPIFPIPNSVRTFFFAAAGVQDINIPDGMCAAIFRGNADYYISFHGAADVPTAATAGNSDNTSRSIWRPDGMMFYAAQAKQISMAVPGAAIVTAMFYAPDQVPQY